jgi:hypothetical protein
VKNWIREKRWVSLWIGKKINSGKYEDKITLSKYQK